jgi:alkanesulfonate monooxygenase SsuD/methylene tetrahydromethanopterin reductase-like flavin-dependent oxidoreductase (luciferase family)
VRAEDREDAITAETVRIVASRPRADGGTTRIVQNRLGIVGAAAGVDASNAEEGTILLLPVDPDANEETEQAALENTRFWAPLSLSKEQKHDITDPIDMERAADALPIEQVAKRWIVGTDPDAVVAQIKDYVDWGFNHLVFHGPGHDQERFMTLFERDLEPRLRAL